MEYIQLLQSRLQSSTSFRHSLVQLESPLGIPPKILGLHLVRVLFFCGSLAFLLYQSPQIPNSVYVHHIQLYNYPYLHLSLTNSRGRYY